MNAFLFLLHTIIIVQQFTYPNTFFYYMYYNLLNKIKNNNLTNIICYLAIVIYSEFVYSMKRLKIQKDIQKCKIRKLLLQLITSRGGRYECVIVGTYIGRQHISDGLKQNQCINITLLSFK